MGLLPVNRWKGWKKTLETETLLSFVQKEESRWLQWEGLPAACAGCPVTGRRSPTAGGQPPAEGASKRRPVRYKLFSLGAGLDMPLLIFILVLLAIGLVMLFSASYANSYYLQGNSYFFISRQAAFAVFGVAAMLVISTFDYHHFHKLSVVVFGIAVFLLVFLLVCRYAHIESIAPPEGDATRWLDFGIVSFQPCEIAKFGLIVLFAHMISQNLDRMGTFRYGVVPYVGIMGLVAALIFFWRATFPPPSSS